MSSMTRRRYLASLSALAFATVLSACRSETPASGTAAGTDGGPSKKKDESALTLRLGHFPNITHASALVGVESGRFATALEGSAKLEVATFNAGPAAVEALLSGALDLAYIGPNPTINAYLKSKGQAVRVISGATSGGAALIVQSEINGPEDLRGKTVASPQLGGTQDVALRAWLQEKGLATDAFGGGDLHIAPQENAQTLEAFRAKTLAGAWVPEPWATRLVLEGQGKVLVDERTLWPNQRFASTVLVVRQEFLQNHREVVKKLLKAHVETTAWARDHGDEARSLVIAGIKKITGKAIAPEVAKAAWANLEITTDPLPDSVRKVAADAEKLGLLKTEGTTLDGLWDLSLLQELGVTTNPEVAKR